jgi:CRP-like cAMP-binding protein
VGEVALAGRAAYDESVVAIRDVMALCVPRDVVVELLAQDPVLCAEVLRLLVARHRAAEDHICALLRSPVEARLASFLLAAAERWGIPEPQGTRIAAPLTHAEIASVLGSTRETVTLALSNLRRAGAIAVDRRQVVILQRDRLEAAASAARSPRGGSRLTAAAINSAAPCRSIQATSVTG